MKDFRAHTQGFRKARCRYRLDHELLNVHVIISMLTAIEDIHHGHWQRHRTATRELSDVLIKRFFGRQGGRFGRREGNREDSVRTKFCFVVRAICLNHPTINA